MSMKDTPTSPYVPDLDQLRAWIEQMVAAMRFVELVVAIIHLISRMRDINAELTKRVAELTRKRPRSETLKRLERQLTLPGLAIATRDSKKKKKDTSETKKSRRGLHPGRGALPAHLPRVQVPNLVPDDQRRCPICGGEMTIVGHSICERLTVIPARIIVEQRVDETLACPRDDTIVSAGAPPAIVERGKLRAALTITGEEIEIDFTGTAPQHTGNLNCPLAVTRSAAYFVVRCVTDPDVPASGGAFAPVTVTAPEGSLLNARPPAAVAPTGTPPSPAGPQSAPPRPARAGRGSICSGRRHRSRSGRARSTRTCMGPSG